MSGATPDLFLLTAVIGLGSAALAARVSLPWIVQRLSRAGIAGRDLNKPGQPEVPEMGGLALVGAIAFGLVVCIGVRELAPTPLPFDSKLLLTALSSVLIIAVIGIIDDLLEIRKRFKLLLPMLAALPLIAINPAGAPIAVPGLGAVELGPLYAMLMVPIGMTGAANAVNILGGFNGLEVGLGLIAASALAIVTFVTGAYSASLVLACTIGALAVTLMWNRFPSKVFIGDVGTLSIGCVLCTACVLGHCEVAGLVLIMPYALDFAIKLRHRLPSTGWWGEYRDGKLFCPSFGPVGLCQLVMKVRGGVGEIQLVRTLYGLELLCAVVVLAWYLVPAM